MRPTKIEWLVAFALFFFLFASWSFGDTAAIVGHEIDFADSIVHGEFSNFYQRAYDRGVDAAAYAKEHGVDPTRGMPAYDVPVNFVLGIWGLPLYFLGGTEYAGNFWKILYGKSFFLLMFIVSAFMVYKICRQLELDENKSQWGAFIYFTSSMAWNSVCLVGNLDAICTALTLAGVLAYLRRRDRECFVWFLLAFPFKQLAMFIYIPLLLLRDKNIFRDALKVIFIAAVNTILSLPVLNCPGAAIAKTKFLGGMILRLFKNTLPMMNGEISIYVIIYGLFCYFCWARTEDEDTHSRNVTAIFTAMAGIAITLGSILSHPQWYLYLAPYLAVSAMLYAGSAQRFMFFETLGSLALLSYNFASFYWVYVPKNAKGMLLDKLLFGETGSVYTDNAFIGNISSPAVKENTMKYLKYLFSVVIRSTGGVYIACMIIILVLLCRKQNLNAARQLSIRPFALSRLILNAAACYLPLAVYLYTSL